MFSSNEFLFSFIDIERFRKKLSKLLPYFRRNVNPDLVLGSLFHHGLIASQEMERIQMIRMRRDRTSELVSIVEKMSNDHFLIFLRSLQETGQENISKSLTTGI